MARSIAPREPAVSASGPPDPSSVGKRVVVRRRLPDGTATDVLGTLVRLDAGGLSVLADRGPDAGTVVDAATADVIAARVVPASTARSSQARTSPAASAPRGGGGEAQEILTLEEVAARGWPAAHTRHLGGWLLRACGGWTRRANSALALGRPGMSILDAVTEVVAFSDEHGVRPRLSLPGDAAGDPLDAELDGHLSSRGWAVEAPTLVLTADLATLLAAAHRRGASQASGGPIERWPVVASASAPSPAWRTAYRHGGQPLSPGALAVMTGPDVLAFAEVSLDDGQAEQAGSPAVALARGSVVDGWLGVTDVQVATPWRRQGLARALVGHLATWAAREGAHSVFVQVEESNAPALSLYAALGATTHHSSRYRTAPR